MIWARCGVLHLRIGEAVLQAEAWSSRGITWSGSAEYRSLDDLTDAIARLAAEPLQPCRRLAVTLERPVLQLRTLPDLPPVKPRALAALVALQAGRFFRKNGMPIVTDAVWVPHTNGGPRMARAAAVEERVLEAIAVGARAAGLVLETIEPAGEPGPMVLLPGTERTARLRAARRLGRRLLVATCAAWGLAGALYLGRLAWERRQVATELATLQEPLDGVLAARRELRDAEAVILTIRRADEGRGRATVLLGALARTLPDSAVLTSVAWRTDGNGVVTGCARRAGDVLARFERVRVLDAPRFEGPIVREVFAGREWERFTIVFGTREPGMGNRERR